MKTLFKVLFAVLALGALTLTSCSKDEDDDPTPMPVPQPQGSSIEVVEVTGNSIEISWDSIEKVFYYEVVYENLTTEVEESMDVYSSEAKITGLDSETDYKVTVIGYDMMMKEKDSFSKTITTTEQTAPSTIELLAVSPADGGELDTRMKRLTFSAQWDDFGYYDEATVTIYVSYDGDVQFTADEIAIEDEDWSASMNSSYGIALPSEFVQSGETANWVAEFTITLEGEEPMTIKSEQFSFIVP